MNVCHLSDGSDVLYNKFNPPPHPDSNYGCVVAEADQWRVAHCEDQHLVTCQSDFLVPGNLYRWICPIIFNQLQSLSCVYLMLKTVRGS